MKVKDLIPWVRKTEPGRAETAQDNPILALQREMNQVFEQLWSRFGRDFGSLDWPFGQSEAKADIVQTDDAVEISIELPGMSMEDIEVSISDDQLTVKGEKKIERQEEKKGYYLSERSYGSIWRTLPLPPGVDATKAEATFKHGVLTIRLPHSAEAKSKVRHIEVKPG